MDKFRYKLMAFMYGRNGTDALYRFTAYIYLGLFVLNIFARSAVISFIALAVFIWAMFRCFSRNLTARQKENRIYIDISSKTKQFFLLRKNMIRDRKTHVYRKCPSCRKMLRLPKKKGEHTVSCPCCRNSFQVKI